MSTKDDNKRENTRPETKDTETELTVAIREDENAPKSKVRRVGSLSQLHIPEEKSEEQEDIRKATGTQKQQEPRQLPDYAKTDVDPDEYLQQLMEAMHGFRLSTQSALELDDEYFPFVTEEQIASYTIEVVAATRENKVEELKKIYETRGRSALDCCNRFGESLLHMACRRGFKDIVTFFLSEVGLGVRIRDDCGRTPLHDVCWNPRVQLDLAAQLLERDPSLLLITDKRGHTPFQYARPQDWTTW
eukprot:CAMPEP_0116832866 /NCGR_PEP_ID=MMETSP0418-20121206/6124_1 /TAXON_ID=1158023 /ORGANISM="Astrosyne radiata, Strain 13vi08-1A" /LENGTH=245 /DNA_ID=CAMNT_0004462263 /DNA_START=139 /DNA_END=873 /DNA_ORIENTATION=+